MCKGLENITPLQCVPLAKLQAVVGAGIALSSHEVFVPATLDDNLIGRWTEDLQQLRSVNPGTCRACGLNVPLNPIKSEWSHIGCLLIYFSYNTKARSAPKTSASLSTQGEGNSPLFPHLYWERTLFDSSPTRVHSQCAASGYRNHAFVGLWCAVHRLMATLVNALLQFPSLPWSLPSCERLQINSAECSQNVELKVEYCPCGEYHLQLYV